MKTAGVKVYLSNNVGFTLPLNMGELGNIEKLDLNNCSLTGLCGMDFFAFCMMVNQFTLFSLIFLQARSRPGFANYKSWSYFS